MSASLYYCGGDQAGRTPMQCLHKEGAPGVSACDRCSAMLLRQQLPNALGSGVAPVCIDRMLESIGFYCKGGQRLTLPCLEVVLKCIVGGVCWCRTQVVNVMWFNDRCAVIAGSVMLSFCTPDVCATRHWREGPRQCAAACKRAQCSVRDSWCSIRVV